MQQPEAYIGGAADLFNPAGEPTQQKTKEFLAKFMQAFAVWIARNA